MQLKSRKAWKWVRRPLSQPVACAGLHAIRGVQGESIWKDMCLNLALFMAHLTPGPSKEILSLNNSTEPLQERRLLSFPHIRHGLLQDRLKIPYLSGSDRPSNRFDARCESFYKVAVTMGGGGCRYAISTVAFAGFRTWCRRQFPQVWKAFFQ